jgi:hypothetical protein
MFDWQIIVDGGRIIGDVTAADQRAAIEAAGTRWPALNGRISARIKTLTDRRRPANPRLIERDLPAAAHHEAGHAVIATHLGLRVRRVAIGGLVGRGDGGFGDFQGCTGSVVFRRPPRIQPLFDPIRRDRAEEFLVMLMAGPLAEARHRRARIDWRRSSVDEAPLIRELAGAHARGLGDGAIATYHKYLAVRAASWVEAYWPQIAAVAEALGRRRELTGDDVEELIRTTPGPRPADALQRAGTR